MYNFIYGQQKKKKSKRTHKGFHTPGGSLLYYGVTPLWPSHLSLCLNLYPSSRSRQSMMEDPISNLDTSKKTSRRRLSQFYRNGTNGNTDWHSDPTLSLPWNTWDLVFRGEKRWGGTLGVISGDIRDIVVRLVQHPLSVNSVLIPYLS